MGRVAAAPATAQRIRCAWVTADPLYQAYHDREWGVPIHDDRRLFELLVLESAQAGLSWLMVLRKREAYREAFDGFDPERVARYGARKVRQLMGNAGIIRNERKIFAAIRNAQAFLKIQKEFGSFDRYQWRFVGGTTKQNAWKTVKELPARTLESDAFSKDLIARGCSFVGSTICYAHMQSAGLVNDHTLDCFRYRQIRGRAR